MGLRSFFRRIFSVRRAPAPQWEWGLDGVEAVRRSTPRPDPGGIPGYAELAAAKPYPEVGILEDEPTVPADAASEVILFQSAQTENAQVTAVLQQVATGDPFLDEDAPKGKVVLVYEDGSEVVLDEEHEMLNEFTRAADRMMRPSGWGRRFAQKVGLGG